MKIDIEERIKNGTHLLNEIKVVEVVKVVVVEGKGTDDSPKRTVLYYYDPQEDRTFRIDLMSESEQEVKE